MPPESERIQKRFPPDDPREWLNRARSNLVQAEKGAEIGGVYFEDLCFNAQQAAEKALKALLIVRQIEFPYVHDLVKLVELLEGSGQKVPVAVREAARITRYAVVTRYPGAARYCNAARLQRSSHHRHRRRPLGRGNYWTGNRRRGHR